MCGCFDHARSTGRGTSGPNQFFESRRACARLPAAETWPSRRLSRPARLIRDSLTLASAVRCFSWPSRGEARGPFFVLRAAEAGSTSAFSAFSPRWAAALRTGLVTELSSLRPATAAAFSVRPPSFSQRPTARALASCFFGGGVALSVDRASRIARSRRPAPARDCPVLRVVRACGPAAGLAVNPGNPARTGLRFFLVFK